LFQKNVPAKGNFIETDKLGNCYLINKNSITKFDENLKLLNTYQEKILGEITSVDVSNIFKNLVFYKDFSTIIILDNNLSEINRINLNNLNILEPLTICKSSKNGFWIYDNSQKKIFYLDEKLNFSNFSIKLSKFIKNSSPTYMLEYDEKIFLNIKNNGILIFNNLGNFENKINIEIENNFQIIGNYIIFYNYNINKIIKFDYINTKSDTINIDQQDILDIKINKTKYYTLTLDSLKIFLVKK